MRLQYYILNENKVIFKDRFYGSNNEDALNDIKHILQKDCNPYIKLVKESKKIAVRIVNQKGIFFAKYKVRSDRRPLDTPLEYHKIFDDMFYNIFKWRARSNSAFTYAAPINIRKNKPLFFPIGKFDYLWSSEIYDLYGWIYELSDYYTDITEFIEDYSIEDLVKEYTMNKGLGKVKGQEVMWRCKEYYILDHQLMMDDKEYKSFINELIK